MSSKEGYDVLRLIEHGQSCYISSEYVKGCILAVWLRYHPNLSKDRLLEWIQDITRQLGLIHRCRGNPCYRPRHNPKVRIYEQQQACQI